MASGRADEQAVFEALAHRARRQILLFLRFRGGRLTAGAIAERFACSWPTTSRHLRVLERAGLVRVERRGRERVYAVDRRRLRSVAGGWLRWFESERSRRAARPSSARAGHPGSRPSPGPGPRKAPR